MPPSAQRDCSDTSTHRAARATRLHSPATAGGGPALGGTCVCHHRRDMIAATRARTVPLARCDSRRLPSPATAGGGPAAIGATRLQRHEQAQCRLRDATALPSHGRWRAQTHAGGGHKPTAGGGHKPMVQTQTSLIHKRSTKIQGLHVVKMFAQSLHCSLPEGM